MSSEASEEIIDVATNLESVQQRMKQTIASCGREDNSVQLVAVSKTKPVDLLMQAYNAGQRRFGENYAQELIGKAKEMPNDIEWHFIGPLQSNKAAPLVKSVYPHLKCVETVSTIKLAKKLDKAVSEVVGGDSDSVEKALGIYIQVNTSGEESKSGISPGDELLALVKDITKECSHLSVDGLMTIGAPGDLTCFDALVQCREQLASALEVPEDSLALSMGMSGDFEDAIRRGATSIRVGSTIFGARDYSNK